MKKAIRVVAVVVAVAAVFAAYKLGRTDGIYHALSAATYTNVTESVRIGKIRMM